MEEKNLYVLLEETIIRELENAALLEEGEEKDNIYKNVVALYKVHNETEKNAFESSDRYSERELGDKHHREDMEQEDAHHREEMELEVKKNQDERFNVIVNAAISVGTTLLGIVTYDIWMRRGLRFEEHGTIVNPWTKNLMSKMTPKK